VTNGRPEKNNTYPLPIHIPEYFPWNPPSTHTPDTPSQITKKRKKKKKKKINSKKSHIHG
jgi:hypothetical protein